jgi:UDP-glucose 4-epimerase
VRIAVTGASGFLGSILTPHLAAAGHEVRTLTRTLPTKDQGAHPGIVWLQGDLASPRDAALLVDGVEAIVHLAWTNTPLTSNAHLPTDASANLLPTLTLLEAVRATSGCPQIVFASSGGAVYGAPSGDLPFREEHECRPQSSYGIQKLTVEQYLRMGSEHGWFTATALRIGNPYGVPLPPERLQGFIGTAVAQLVAGDPVRVFGNPGNVRDYVHLSDVSRAIEMALEPRAPFDVFNIGSGTAHSVEDVLRLLEEVVGAPLAVHTEWSEAADDLPSWVVLDAGKALAVLGWAAEISLREGLARLIAWPASTEAAASSPE